MMMGWGLRISDGWVGEVVDVDVLVAFGMKGIVNDAW